MLLGTFSHLASGAETGWDYSTRWFRDPASFASIQTRYVVPVDLNSLLYDVELYLGELATLFGDDAQAEYYRSQVCQQPGRQQPLHGE